MKKITALILALVMVFALAACGETPAEPTDTPEPELSGDELAAHYKAAIEGARSEQDNADRGINTSADAEEMGSIMWEVLGFTAEDVDAFAVSMSIMNVQAYCVGLFKPVEGKAEAVVAGLENYIAGQQRGFESYLPDQGVIADNAILETLDDGTVIIVMSDGWDDVYAGITEAL